MSYPQRDRRRPDRIAPPARTGHTALLVAGFLAVTVAIFVAHASPASRYETSLYAATPLAFWAGVAVAAACALAVAFGRPSRGSRRLAMGLAGETFVAVLALPVVRGYHFFTAGDPLSHLGWIRNVLRGELALEALIYPGVHTVAIYLYRLAGLGLEHAMLLTVVVFAVLFVAFVPLVAGALDRSAVAVPVGAFAAMLVLPINNVSVHLSFFPSTMAVFFVPFVLLLAVVALGDTGGRLTPVDALLGLGTLGIVLYHPQQAANLLLVLGTVTVGAFVFRWRGDARPLDPLGRHTALLGVVLVGWGLLHERITRTAGAFTGEVSGAIFAGGASGGGAVAQRTGSLAAIGTSPLELGVKLFLPGLVFAVLTALLVGVTLVRSLRRDAESRVPALVGLGLVPVGVVMALYVFANLQTIYFRHLGFMMALATVFGAVALARALTGADRRGFDRGSVAVGGVVLAALLVLSMATVFSSPFIHQANDQVTEMQMGGHETAFAHENESIGYAGIRAGPGRFRDAIEGTFDLDLGGGPESTRVPFGELDGDLTAVFGEERYLVVSRADVVRETVAYHNLRYDEAGFERLDRRPGVDRVIANGEFRLYHVAE